MNNSAATNAATIAAIHHSGHALVLAITGGGSSVIGDLLRIPGGSQSVLEAVVPYSEAALRLWLYGQPDQACAPRTARGMAMAAWMRARALADAEFPIQRLIGLGCTASLASDRPKRGPHRVHIAWQSLAATNTMSLELNKGTRTRAEEETLVAALIVDALGEAASAAPRVPPELLPGEVPVITATVAPLAWQELLLGQRQRVAGPETNAAAHTKAIFPGAFNPLHDGHRTMARIAAQRLQMPVAYELSIKNVDKSPLDYTEIEERVTKLAGESSYWLTRAPTFVAKSAIFPGATFILGADTVIRIADPKYYGDLPARDAALETIANNGCRFLVFGRASQHDFLTLDELALPPALRALCDQVPPEDFRMDIHSTDLRRQK
jgi:hypothetical protein